MTLGGGSTHAGLVDDVLLVPVSISYDRILERNFVKEELMVSVDKHATGRGHHQMFAGQVVHNIMYFWSHHSCPW